MLDAVAHPTLRPAPQRAAAAVPAWIWASGAFLVLASVVLALPRWVEPPETGLLVLFEVRLLIEGAAYLWAAGRRELPRALRGVLRLTGGISVVSLLTNLPLFWVSGRAPEWLGLALDGWMFLSYMLSALALLLWPRVVARRWDALTLLLDLVITAGAMGALVLIEVTFPLADATPDVAETRWSLIYGLAQVASLAGLSVMVVRGRPVPSRRAFWWFVGAQAAYLPALLLSQLGMAEVITKVAGRVLYVLGVLPALVAAVHIRRDPVDLEPATAGPLWLRDLSPLPLVTPVLVVVALLHAMTEGPPSRVQPLVAMLIVTTLLLVIRVLLSAGESAARLREEAERERRLQREKLATVGQQYLVGHGVPEAAVVVRPEGRSTQSSVRSVADWALERDTPRVLLVSDPFHMLRLRIEASRAGLTAFACPTRTSPISQRPSAELFFFAQEAWKIPVVLMGVRAER